MQLMEAMTATFVLVDNVVLRYYPHYDLGSRTVLRGLDAEMLIRNADAAMYQAKQNGNRSYQFFKLSMNV